MKKRLVVLAMVLGLVVGLVGSVVAGDTTTVSVSASVTGTCKFISGGTISYTLDPSAGGNVSGTVSQPTFWCTKGSSYTITDDNGINKSGTTYRMKHATLGEYIPYSFTYTSTGTGSGKGTTLTMNIGSQVLGTDYVNASAGNYADTVTLTVNP